MKHTVTELDDSNEPVLFTDTIMGNYMVDSFFGNLEDESSSVQDPKQQFEVYHFTQVLDEIPVLNAAHLDLNNGLWSLYFDGSKSKEGAGAGCLLIYSHRKRYFVSFRLEFECTIILLNMKPLFKG